MNVYTDPNNQMVELGKVAWLREYDDALAISEKTGKPIFMFFQEIPGCSTCVDYGVDVLSNPLMVEFIENEFVPLAIFNNKEGRDAEILKQYSEPSWNNPVSRFIDEKGDDIVPRFANNYKPLGLFQKMIEVLNMCQNPIPEYAKLLEYDLKVAYGHAATTVYETPCFWSGETSLAQHPAVMVTNAGWIGHKEVVKISFDAEKVSMEELDDYAKEQGFYKVESHETFRLDKEPQYYLSKSPYADLDLSPAQRTKLNVAIPYKKNLVSYLSPKQYQRLLDSNVKYA